MSYTVIQPSADLRDFVSHFWAGQWGNGNATYFSTANTQVELAFGFQCSADNKHQELIFSTILGHTENFGQFAMKDRMDLFGLSIYAHSIPLLFNLPASELTDKVLSVEDLLKGQGRVINEMMAATATTSGRIKILTDFFKSQLVKRSVEDNVILDAIKQIRQYRGIVNIRNLAVGSCLSQKQFERRFVAKTGFNPKLYSRIIRFETALWGRNSHHTLTEVAHASGYYDQAHFIHEFKKFSGFSPKEFLSLTGY